jgi:prevent-host-death family protein
MKSFTATALRDQTGALLDRVIAGETVQVTRHGRPIAYLVSASTYEALGLDLSPDAPDTQGAATVREIADATCTSVPVVSRAVTDLMADPQWSRERVIAAASDNFGATLIHKDAAAHIAQLLIARYPVKKETA